MEARGKQQKPSEEGKTLATCSDCRGTGKVARKLHFLANPKAPATRADKLGLQTCPTCKGRGRTTVEQVS